MNNLKNMRRIAVASCLILLGAAAGLPVMAGDKVTGFQERFAEAGLLKLLRQGGFVLYMRHGTTDNSRADRAPSVDLNDCNTQRVLDDAGRKLAAAIGQSIAKAGIPVGEVYHSPMCRARETAELAFPALIKQLMPDLNLAYTANLTTEEKKPVVAETRRLVSAPVADGSNRVIVAHAPNLADLMGYFVKPEGTVVVLRPLGEARFEYVASIPPALWSKLLK